MVDICLDQKTVSRVGAIADDEKQIIHETDIEDPGNLVYTQVNESGEPEGEDGIHECKRPTETSTISITQKHEEPSTKITHNWADSQHRVAASIDDEQKNRLVARNSQVRWQLTSFRNR